MPGHFYVELRTSFARHADRPAVWHRGQSITYGELDRQARRAAALMQHLGVEPGDPVALFTANKLPLLVAHLGALYAGAAPLPLNARYTREEMRYFLNDSGARIVVAGAEQLAWVEALAAELPQPAMAVLDAAVYAASSDAWHEPTSGPDDACLMLYSSGTTGWPKGVVHTQASASTGLQSLGAHWRMNPQDVVVNALPLFHIHGLAFATHLTWLFGGCVAIEDSFEPDSALAAMRRATVLMSVPTIYYRLLEEPAFLQSGGSWKHLRLLTCGSAPIRPEVLPELERILGGPIINRYGMTEGYVLTSLPLEGPWPAGSVGIPLDGVELEIHRADGEAATPNEAGAVMVRGANLFREYWRKPDATRAAFIEGWFDTGDLGWRDDQGFLTLVGRKHDMIITSGFNVYPQVVERVIAECPGVKECAVVGVADSARGERVAAAVVRDNLALDEDTLRAWLSDRLVYYQQPKQIAFVEALPRNSLGKVLRRELRELF